MKGSHNCTVVNFISVTNVKDFPELQLKRNQMSVEDKRCMSTMESCNELRNGNYYLHSSLPNNDQQAQQCVMSLKRRFYKNKLHHKKYTGFLEGGRKGPRRESAISGTGKEKWKVVVNSTLWSAPSKKGFPESRVRLISILSRKIYEEEVDSRSNPH